MILLFRDNSVNYWLNNTVVDCGKADTPNNNLDIELPEDISSDDLENTLDLEFNPSINFDKKLNKKLKHNNDIEYNESNHKKVYFGRNTKIVDGNPRKKDSRCKFNGYKYKYKDTNIRINDIQKTTKHKCVSKYSNTYYHEGQMRQMPKTGSLYNYE